MKIFPGETAYIINLPYHLAYANMDDEFCAILTDYDFINHKISTSSPQLLIEDYNLASPLNIPKTEKDNLRLIQGAIDKSAHILTNNKTQLAGHLIGRLLPFTTPQIQTLLQQAQQQNNPWLRPLTPSLTPPGGSLRG